MRAACSSAPSYNGSKLTQQRSSPQHAALRSGGPRSAAATQTSMPFTSLVTGTAAVSNLVGRPKIEQPLSSLALSFLDHQDVFVCDEESSFYSSCLEELVFSAAHYDFDSIIEFGSGDGSPVLNALVRCRFSGVINGFELNAKASALARRGARAMQLHNNYRVHNSCFFEGAAALPAAASTLISNPPYIAAPDDNLLMPALHGGTDGANLTRELMSMGFGSAMLLLCSYCDPVRTLAHAKNEGYAVVDFRVTDLPFGAYSSEPKVLDWIRGMRADGRAFFSDGSYRLAGVLLRKEEQASSAGSSEDGGSGDESSSRDLSSTGSSTSSDRSEDLLSMLLAA